MKDCRLLSFNWSAQCHLFGNPLQYSVELRSLFIGRYAFSLLNLAFTHCSFFLIKMKFDGLKLHLYFFKPYTKSARKIEVTICDSKQLPHPFQVTKC